MVPGLRGTRQEEARRGNHATFRRIQYICHSRNLNGLPQWTLLSYRALPEEWRIESIRHDIGPLRLGIMRSNDLGSAHRPLQLVGLLFLLRVLYVAQAKL